MNRKSLIKATLVAAFFFIAFGAWLLHAKIHPPAERAVNLIPFVAGFTSTFILTLLFCFRPTVFLAYLVNGMLCIVGIITMAHFSVAQWSLTNFQPPLTLVSLFLGTMMPDIIIVCGKFCLGKAIFDLESLKSDTSTTTPGRFWRWPNMGWWWVHFVGLTAVYVIGHLLWK